MLNNTFLTSNTAILLIGGAWIFTFLLTGFGRISFSKKQIVIIASLTIFIIALSLLVSTSGDSGMGTSTKFGWPHFYYQTWKSFEDSTSFSSFSLLYFTINFFIISGVVTLLMIVITQTFELIRGRNG